MTRKQRRRNGHRVERAVKRETRRDGVLYKQRREALREREAQDERGRK